MKLTPIAQSVILNSYSKLIVESVGGDAKAIQSQLFSLGTELKKDGEDVTDEEVQAALLSALIDADGKIDSVDVSDVESIKTEIKESRSYINEAGVLHGIEAVGTVLGNSAFIETLADGLQKIGLKNVDEKTLKSKLDKAVNGIKSVTGFPAKVMEKAFGWIAKKMGATVSNQKIAGLTGTLLVTVTLLSIAVALFPSITSGVLLVFAISGMIGKGAEIVKLVKEIIHHLGEHSSELKVA
jgi:hypothetical protein